MNIQAARAAQKFTDSYCYCGNYCVSPVRPPSKTLLRSVEGADLPDTQDIQGGPGSWRLLRVFASYPEQALLTKVQQHCT